MASSAGKVALLAAVALGVAGLALAGLVARFDASGLPEVTRYRDDAYYYFVFVRSLAAGDGPCVTPGEPTSGVHVLWALLLLPLWLLFGEGGCIVGAQHLGLGLHVLTAVGLWAIMGRDRRALALAALYAGNPYLVSEAQNGQETALACAMTLALWWGFGCGRAVATAVTVLAVLARSDLLFLAAAFAVARWGLGVRALVPLACAGAVYAATNVALAGHPLQDSAAPIPWLFAAHFERTHPDALARVQRWWWYLRPVLLGGPFGVVSPVFGAVLVTTSAGRLWGARWRAVPLLLTGLGVLLGASDVAVPLLAGVLLLCGAGQERDARAARFHAAALAGFAALVALHLVVRTYPREYYFAPMGVLGVLAFAGLRPAFATVACGLLAAGNVVGLLGPRPAFTWQEQMAMAGRFLRAVVPAGEPVGCFNSGILAFHDPGPVVNLDGVVNRAAFAALQQGALGAYLDARAIRFLVDSPVQFRRDDPWPHCSGAHFGADFDPERDLVEVARCVVPGVDEPFVAYWRAGRGAPPVAPQGARVLGAAPSHGDRRAGAYVLWRAAAGDRLWLRGPGTAEAALLLAAVDRATTVIVRVDAKGPGRHLLLANADPAPILTLDL